MISAFAGTIEVHDAQEYEQAAAPWELKLEQISTGPFYARLEFLSTDHLILTRETRSAVVRCDGQTAAGLFTFGGSLPDSRPLRWCGSDLDADTLGLGRAGLEATAVLPHDAAHWELLVDESLVLRYADDWHIDPDSLRGARRLTVHPAALRDLGMKLAHRLDRYLRRPKPLSTPETRQELEHDILRSVLECASSGQARPGSRTPGQPRRRVVRRAIELVHESRVTPTIPALAAEAGVSQRTLQYAFREAMGLTPVRYLRLHRLNLVRRVLRELGPADTTVSRVAGRHGFTELGRFAGEYRALFGESPSETLRTYYPATAASLESFSPVTNRVAKNA